MILAAAAIIVLFGVSVASCMSRSKRFAEVADIEGVETLRLGASVSKLADLALKNDKNGHGNDDLSSYMTSVKDIEIVHCDDSSEIPAVTEKCRAIIETMGYTPMLEQGDSDMIFIGPKGKNDGEATGIIIVDRSEGEYNMVLVEGTVIVDKLADHFLNHEKGWKRAGD